jgi:peptidoglycan hydrolase CwlO-like protein
MSIFSMITIGSTVGEVVTNVILAAFLWILANYCFQLVTKINAVHEFMLTYSEKHKSLEKELTRIDADVKKISTDLKEQITDLNDKLDDFMGEIRKDRHTV